MNTLPATGHLARNAGSNGAALLICLLLLAALTLLGLAAAWDHALQQRMTNNLLERAHAEQSANTALEWGESWLLGLQGEIRPTACSDNCTATDVIRAAGTYGPTPRYQDLNWWKSNAFSAGTDPATGIIMDVYLANNNSSSFYFIEEFHGDIINSPETSVNETVHYKLLARGSSGPSSNYAITESFIARPWGDAALTNSFPPTDNSTSFCYLNTVITPCGRQAWRQLQ